MKCEYDIIIILGRGINSDGTLSSDPLLRVTKGVELYNFNLAPKILMSGLWSYRLDVLPPKPEAVAMKDYAVDLQVTEENILVEVKSKDTLGNAYFTKIDFCIPNSWKNIIVVTSQDHLERTKYIFKKVYGADYNIRYEVAVRDKVQTENEKIREEKSLRILRDWIDMIDDGDDRRLSTLLFSKHPGYALNPEVTKEQLIKMIED